MTRLRETVQVSKEIEVYYCDRCDGRIGESPVTDHGGYFVSCPEQPRDDHGPHWWAILCSDCMDELRRFATGPTD